MRYTSEMLPVHTLPDGRKFVTDQDIQEFGPAAGEFMKRFTNYWTRDPMRDGWVGPVELPQIAIPGSR